MNRSTCRLALHSLPWLFLTETFRRLRLPIRISLWITASVLVLPQINHAQTFHSLYSFRGPENGAYAFAGLVQARDGNFYGTTQTGTIFRITTAGKLTVLYDFGNTGVNPSSSLLQAKDGNLYGTTSGDDFHILGTVFRITTGGTLTTLHSFSGPDGVSPYAGLLQANDGNLYGTTYNGGTNNGTNNGGTVYQITTDGALTTLYSFAYGDGSSPADALIQASDGNLYGTTTYSDVSGYGTIFRITTGGGFATMHRFDYTDAATPYACLFQARNGKLYGTATGGGLYGLGTVYSLDINSISLQRLTLTPNVVLGSKSVTGVVTLTGTAKTNTVVSLFSSNRTDASVPTRVTIAAGKQSATFTLSTKSVTTPTTVAIAATDNGVTVTAMLTLTP